MEGSWRLVIGEIFLLKGENVPTVNENVGTLRRTKE